MIFPRDVVVGEENSSSRSTVLYCFVGGISVSDHLI